MVSGNQDLSAALPGRCRDAQPTPTAPPACPAQGPGGVGGNPDPTPRTDAPPTANHHQGRRRTRRPSMEELQRQVQEDGGGEATDGCFVEPDGTCEHGQPSWLLALGLI